MDQTGCSDCIDCREVRVIAPIANPQPWIAVPDDRHKTLHIRCMHRGRWVPSEPSGIVPRSQLRRS
jgi:Fe-S-cluster-containing hydrogenase component 2